MGSIIAVNGFYQATYKDNFIIAIFVVELSIHLEIYIASKNI